MPTLFDLFYQFDIDTCSVEPSIVYPTRSKDLSGNKTLRSLCRENSKNDRTIAKKYRKKEKKAEPNVQKLQQKIELLRLQLHQMACQKGFLDQSVIELSQKLDTYIVLYQRLVSPYRE
ncbi:aspartyl-phosphate phosphatase Spo0E family protein [Brevibacillus migulae]|uniref:aspartyl-phosphate phosphatase Spo0E family protein n=1 Tax=Brevibacillus migulae TaxID=1644114 RepID=UPI00106E73E5|nr:aspartyl-phosphate phosphatase Spo0E family protein [Brevibacillus migulae]